MIGNIYITRDGFTGRTTPDPPTTSTLLNPECSYDEEDDENCNLIEDPNNNYFVHNVCPKDPRCLGICINDHMD